MPDAPRPSGADDAGPHLPGHLFLGGAGPEGGAPLRLRLDRANRHGLIAGATGTGKTVTLQVLAEAFSASGVPVFLSDVKGDLSGLCQPGDPAQRAHPALIARAEGIGLTDFGYEAPPTVFWDVFGRDGHPVRATVSELGPLMLARMLELTEVQEGVLNVAFRLADDEGLLLLDLKDLQALLTEVHARAPELSARYGNVARASIGAIQRRLLTLETQGAAAFLGEPSLRLEDMMATPGGRGQVNVLAAARLMQAPRLYAVFLLWLLSELFEALPEVGDPEKPRFVLFFDEAHLLFKDTSRSLTDRIEQVVRLIRSKGVGVYFITQNPTDLPESVLGQLGNRVQHALRAFTPRDQRAVRVAAQTFRANPALDTATVITELGVGEALVSVLDEKGRPTPVERTLIRPPSSRMGPLSNEERHQVVATSVLAGVYDEVVDRESAYEILKSQAEAALAEEHQPETRPQKAAPKARKTARRGDSVLAATAKSTARSIGTQIGRQIVRGLLGSLTGRRR